MSVYKETDNYQRTTVYIGDNGTGWQEDTFGTETYESVYLEDGTNVRYSTRESLTIETPIVKSKDDQHLVFGWANVSLDTDGSAPIDWQGDETDPEVLEKAAYNFVLKHRTTGEMHKGPSVGLLVESVMLTKQKQASMGIPEGVVPEGWWIGFYVPDDTIVAKIKSGEYKMFSIQGKAKRVED
ncbi:hypothetical protein D3C79_643990 [compost metagenome]